MVTKRAYPRLAVLMAGVATLAIGLSPGGRGLLAQEHTSTPAAAVAQGRGQRSGQPPRVGQTSWEWWNDAEVKKELGLSDQKVSRLQNYYQLRIKQLSPTADQFQREFEKLDQMTRERTVDEGTYALQVTVVEALRSKLLESRTVMLYRMYMELSQDQYKKLLEIRDRKFRRGGRPSL